jgi:hypothetical protein
LAEGFVLELKFSRLTTNEEPTTMMEVFEVKTPAKATVKVAVRKADGVGI